MGCDIGNPNKMPMSIPIPVRVVDPEPSDAIRRENPFRFAGPVSLGTDAVDNSCAVTCIAM
jgi:hypothetical protein